MRFAGDRSYRSSHDGVCSAPSLLNTFDSSAEPVRSRLKLVDRVSENGHIACRNRTGGVAIFLPQQSCCRDVIYVQQRRL